MEGGSTFVARDPDSGKEHLWVIISDPAVDPNKVLFVNLTTPAEGKESTCVVRQHEHPWLRYDSWVSYADSKVTSLARLYQAKDAGLLKISDPVSAEVLRRIREGVPRSIRMSLEHAAVLEEQGLVEL